MLILQLILVAKDGNLRWEYFFLKKKLALNGAAGEPQGRGRVYSATALSAPLAGYLKSS